MIERVYIQQLTERILEQRNFIQVVMEPRQVGKTTLVLQFLKDIDISNSFESADAVLNSSSEWILQVWESARLKMKLSKVAEHLLVIDEVQKIANWSEIVKHRLRFFGLPLMSVA